LLCWCVYWSHLLIRKWKTSSSTLSRRNIASSCSIVSATNCANWNWNLAKASILLSNFCPWKDSKLSPFDTAPWLQLPRLLRLSNTFLERFWPIVPTNSCLNWENSRRSASASATGLVFSTAAVHRWPSYDCHLILAFLPWPDWTGATHPICGRIWRKFDFSMVKDAPHSTRSSPSLLIWMDFKIFEISSLLRGSLLLKMFPCHRWKFWPKQVIHCLRSEWWASASVVVTPVLSAFTTNKKKNASKISIIERGINSFVLLYCQ